MRRQRGMRGVGVVLAVLLAVIGCGSQNAPSPVPAPQLVAPSSGPSPGPSSGPSSSPAPGTPDWPLHDPGPEHAIEGFADHVSVLPGQPVRLYVSTTAPSWTVTAFRFGDYTGADARAIWTSPPQPGRAQAPAVVQQPTSTVVAPWQPSLAVATDGWDPGDYLLRLDAVGGVGQRFVPLTVRTGSNVGRVVVVNAVTTWQAYNLWGGYDLYKGPDGTRGIRSRAVSFDRPYELPFQGAGQFLEFELGFLRVAERAGVPLGYATDIDLHADPHLLDGARAVFTLGHDEYWSAAMRVNAAAARDAGVNLAFLGGNEDYRHIRLAATPVGENRLEINYKSFTEDPVHLTDPAEATQDWGKPPDPRPESELVGVTYRCFPGRADLVVADPDSWLLQGLVQPGQRFPGAVGIEYSEVDLSSPAPRPMEVLFHSPVICGATKRADFADAVYYTVPSGAGVFSSGTQDWVCGMDPACAQSGVAPTLDAITTRLLQAFAAGPAARAHPAVDNLAALRIGVPR